MSERYSRFAAALVEAGSAFTLSRAGQYATGGDHSLHFVPLFGDEQEALSFATGEWEGMEIVEVTASEVATLLDAFAQDGVCVGFFLNDTQPPMIFDAKLLLDELSILQRQVRK